MRHRPNEVARAVDANLLETRADSNQRFGTSDFNGWVRGLLAPLQFSSVLDLCCGTGNQLLLYAARPAVERIVGLDVSRDALKIAKSRMREAGAWQSTTLLSMPMETAFAGAPLRDSRFDLISCFYGLYYADDARRVLKGMIGHLNLPGNLLVVGPYGRNNASLFNLLESHFALPQRVVFNATTFMEEEVLPPVTRDLDMRIETFVNEVRFPSAEALLRYWRATIFYDSRHEGAVERDVKAHFRRHDEFVVEKHVMAAIGRNIH